MTLRLTGLQGQAVEVPLQDLPVLAGPAGDGAPPPAPAAAPAQTAPPVASEAGPPVEAVGQA